MAAVVMMEPTTRPTNRPSNLVPGAVFVIVVVVVVVVVDVGQSSGSVIGWQVHSDLMTRRTAVTHWSTPRLRVSRTTRPSTPG